MCVQLWWKRRELISRALSTFVFFNSMCFSWFYDGFSCGSQNYRPDFVTCSLLARCIYFCVHLSKIAWESRKEKIDQEDIILSQHCNSSTMQSFRRNVLNVRFCQRLQGDRKVQCVGCIRNGLQCWRSVTVPVIKANASGTYNCNTSWSNWWYTT